MQGYAWEITTVEGGWGLHGVLQSRQPVLNGVVNGIDLVEWDPETDEHTPAQYSASDLAGTALTVHFVGLARRCQHVQWILDMLIQVAIPGCACMACLHCISV